MPRGEETIEGEKTKCEGRRVCSPSFLKWRGSDASKWKRVMCNFPFDAGPHPLDIPISTKQFQCPGEQYYSPQATPLYTYILHTLYIYRNTHVSIGEILRSRAHTFSVLMAANKLCVYGNTHCIDVYKDEYMVIMERHGAQKEGKTF